MPMPSLTRRLLLTTALAPQWLQAQPAAGDPPPRPAQPLQQSKPPWRVGPGEALTRIADALRLAGDGDTIEVLPGTYSGDVAVITQRRLDIVGIGVQPVLDAAGQHAEGKAIWVVRDGDIRIHNIGFRGARVPDSNGAGIRFEHGRLQLQGCSFHDNQNGVLASNDSHSVLEVTDCVFSQAPETAAPPPHLIYVGQIGLFILRGCLLRQGKGGHLVKSRAQQARLIANRLDDGHSGEASYEIDLPNGGVALVEGNTVVQSPHTRNPVMLSYGAEGAHWAVNRLTLRDNTFINRRAAGGWFVRVWDQRLPADTVVHSSRNRWLGPGSLALGPHGVSSDDSRGPLPAAND